MRNHPQITVWQGFTKQHQPGLQQFARQLTINIQPCLAFPLPSQQFLAGGHRIGDGQGEPVFRPTGASTMAKPVVVSHGFKNMPVAETAG